MIREEFERRILHGLCCEWKTKTSQLNPMERKGFVEPLFAIREFKSRWGSWSSEKREISLSAELVYSHSWGAVREVLFHEMAHQFAEQVLFGRNETPHGPSFRRACHTLRANPKASAGHCLQDQRLAGGPGGRELRILSWVRKLLALGRSENPYEAEAAVAKAHELLRSHQLNPDGEPQTQDFMSALVGKPSLRHSREPYALANILQDFYFVCGVWVPAYVLERARMGTVLEITGRAHNVKTACYVHDFVLKFIEARWKDYGGAGRLNRRRKTDFGVGVIEGFRKRLAEGTQTGNECRAGLSLVAWKDGELEKHVAYRYPHLRRIRGKPVQRDERALRDGIAIGQDLIIHRGIEDPANRDIRRLPFPHLKR